MITALGIDPGLRVTGYSIVQGDRQGCRAIELGLIRSAQPELAARVAEVHRHLSAILRKHRPQVVALEDIFAHHTFPRTALHLAHLRGAISLAAAQAGIPVENLSPAAVKRALTGSGRASKAQVQAVVAQALGLAAPPAHHAADATALALTTLSRRGVALRAARAAVETPA
ncbi:MAG: crossover junction endodeoxyribonuclease RuvC [Armatimonadota bacterium]|nr:crossover junction endodeoxyribonuclease RuvC [Armatimonadota bacterium]MDR7427271.1 crossover junction endodeoxyribonuclease RuvC [Armatimonadota bacterium]MDR7468858.1 crossover junction endodeoxyribonuclease RuvC [Armatimonadota bacterium]